MKPMHVILVLTTVLGSSSLYADPNLSDLGVKPDNRPDYARPGKPMNPPPPPKRTSSQMDKAVQTWKDYGRPTPITKPGPGIKVTTEY